MTHSLFQPVVPSMQGVVPSTPSERASRAGDVGITFVTSSPPNVTGWSFVFPLEGFQSYKFQEHVGTEAVIELFGHVVPHSMVKSLTMLNGASKSAWEDYMMTLESR